MKKWAVLVLAVLVVFSGTVTPGYAGGSGGHGGGGGWHGGGGHWHGGGWH
jgi:hypothetical protein